MFDSFNTWTKRIALAGALALPFASCDNPVEPPETAEVSLEVNLIEDVDIGWNVSFQNAPSARLSVQKNSTSMPEWDKNITSTNSSGTFNDAEKGNYLLQACATGEDNQEICKMRSVNVPNYLPEANFNGLSTELNEGNTLNVNLEGRFTDKNPEDNNSIEILNVSPLDDKTEASLDGSLLTIIGQGTHTGQYRVQIQYGSESGGINSSNLTGNILDLVRISGQLQDNITDTGRQGEINIYNEEISQNGFLGRIQADNEGNFDFKIEDLDIKNNNLILEAIGNGDNYYTRTISLPARDTSELIVRTHGLSRELTDAGVNREDFRTFAEEINPRFIKWNLERLLQKGGEILYENPFGGGNFTSVQQDSIEKELRENLSCYTGNYPNIGDIPIQKDSLGMPDSLKHYTIGTNIEGNPTFDFEEDMFFVTRDTTIDKTYNASATTWSRPDGTIPNFLIRLKIIRDATIAHEEGHGFIAPNRSPEIFKYPLTILKNPSTYGASASPGPADCEMGFVLYDSTYSPRGGGLFENPHDEVLGLEFGNFTRTDSPLTVYAGNNVSSTAPSQ